MMTNAGGLLFNPDDIRDIVIRARMLGMRRETAFAALTRHLDDDCLTAKVVRQIFEEEWPSEDA